MLVQSRSYCAELVRCVSCAQKISGMPRDVDPVPTSEIEGQESAMTQQASIKQSENFHLRSQGLQTKCPVAIGNPGSENGLTVGG